jgi:Fusaric acid resistance protein-like
MTVQSPVAADTPPFDPARAAVFAIGIGAPVTANLLLGGPAMALFAGVGALNALITDPRRGAAARVISIAVAMGAILTVALLGTAMQPNPDLALAVAIAFAFPAGLVPPAFPYLSMVAKLLPLTIIVVATGVFPSGHVVVGFLVGTTFAMLATISEAALRHIVPYADPMHELVALWRGTRNDLAYAIAFTGAVGLALCVARVAAATHPLWAVVAALFVMHPDPDLAMRRIAKRIGGTFAGVAAAWTVVRFIDSPWPLVALATVAAGLMPWSIARGVFWGTMIATVFLLLLFDVGMIAQGGDKPLIFARLWDTLIGTAAVAVATYLLGLWRRWRPPRPDTRESPDPLEPDHAAMLGPDVHL